MCFSWPGVVIGGQETVPFERLCFSLSAQKPSRETDPSPGRLSEQHCSREVPVLLTCAGVRPCPLFLTHSLPETLQAFEVDESIR